MEFGQTTWEVIQKHQPVVVPSAFGAKEFGYLGLTYYLPTLLTIALPGSFFANRCFLQETATEKIANHLDTNLPRRNQASFGPSIFR